jgi:hypothetical protein
MAVRIRVLGKNQPKPSPTSVLPSPLLFLRKGKNPYPSSIGEDIIKKSHREK